jgi:hypothetical protein
LRRSVACPPDSTVSQRVSGALQYSTGSGHDVMWSVASLGTSHRRVCSRMSRVGPTAGTGHCSRPAQCARAKRIYGLLLIVLISPREER